ncbi:MAG TPA: hypothetical protein DCE41_35840 [Cytophagales bacterium]|nr:hypothetical protein [Cytophagales bacterium]HAA21278.1 hypothetical protein [Cytophagales bacterium]HAP59410.1 hypothetical protein [Cytophagales bacterium]
MTFSIKLSLEDFRKAIMATYRRQRFSKGLTIIGILIFFSAVVELLAGREVSNPFGFVFLFVLSFAFIFGMPLLVRAQAVRAYATNPQVQETISYTLGEDTLQIQGESFNATHYWKKLDQVVETKQHIFIYQTAQQVHVIPKAQLSGSELAQLKIELSEKDIPKIQLLK